MELAEIQTAIAANPALKTGLVGALREDVLSVVKGEGMIFRTADEEAEYIANYEKTTLPGKVSAEIGAKVKEVHDRYDADILEATGLKKGPNEKTYEFNKRVLKELAAQAKAGGGDEVLKGQLLAAQKELEKYADYVPKDEVENLKKDFSARIVKGNIATALNGKTIAVPAHLTDDAGKASYAGGIKGLIESQFLTKYTPKEDKEGHTVYYEGDKPQIDTKTGKALTESDLITRDFGHYFQPEKKAAGGGGGNGGKQDNLAEADLKSKEQVMKHLTDKGMTMGATDFNKEYARIVKEQGITE